MSYFETKGSKTTRAERKQHMRRQRLDKKTTAKIKEFVFNYMRNKYNATANDSDAMKNAFGRKAQLLTNLYKSKGRKYILNIINHAEQTGKIKTK